MFPSFLAASIHHPTVKPKSEQSSVHVDLHTPPGHTASSFIGATRANTGSQRGAPGRCVCQWFVGSGLWAHAHRQIGQARAGRGDRVGSGCVRQPGKDRVRALGQVLAPDIHQVVLQRLGQLQVPARGAAMNSSEAAKAAGSERPWLRQREAAARGRAPRLGARALRRRRSAAAMPARPQRRQTTRAAEAKTESMSGCRRSTTLHSLSRFSLSHTLSLTLSLATT